jgi:drug/metabolite transporter (DMT)-like permease
MALIVAGVYVTVGTGAVAAPAGAARLVGASWRGSLLGLGTAAYWAISPLLIREGLQEVPSPGLGVTISIFAATIPQGVVVALRRRRGLGEPPMRDALAPTVILVAPPLAGRQEEPITARILVGATLVVVGALVLVVRTCTPADHPVGTIDRTWLVYAIG